MVFAFAAILFQLSATAPASLVASTLPPSISAMAADKSRPQPEAKSAPVAASSTEGTPASGTHLNLDSVSLDGNSKVSSDPKITAISLGEAQNSQAFSTVRIPEAQPGKPIKVSVAETRPSSRSWLALSLVQHGAAAFDAYSTRQAVGRGAVELDPMMRPFAHSSAIYGAIQVGPVLLDMLSHHMQRSENRIARRMWWVPQSVSSAAFIFSGVHNLNVAGRP